MRIRRILMLAAALLVTGTAGAQERMRVVIDNDFAGDADGLFALAQLMRSPSVDVRAIVGSHLHDGENWTAKGRPSAATAVTNVNALLEVMGLSGRCTVAEGSNTPLSDSLTAVRTSATDIIIKEAEQCSAESPLYLLCGGGLTEIASVWLLRPELSDRMIVVWIGGAEYPGFIAPPGVKGGEYNTTIDIRAAQVVFNRSNLRLWQIPRNAYRQCLISRSVLRNRIQGARPEAEYLADMLEAYIGPGKLSESYVLGDSPLVLVSALQSNWERDACSSYYTMRPCPVVDDNGIFHFDDCSRREIRVFDRIDTYLMFEDMFAKFKAD